MPVARWGLVVRSTCRLLCPLDHTATTHRAARRSSYTQVLFFIHGAVADASPSVLRCADFFGGGMALVALHVGPERPRAAPPFYVRGCCPCSSTHAVGALACLALHAYRLQLDMRDSIPHFPMFSAAGWEISSHGSARCRLLGGGRAPRDGRGIDLGDFGVHHRSPRLCFGADPFCEKARQVERCGVAPVCWFFVRAIW